MRIRNVPLALRHSPPRRNVAVHLCVYVCVCVCLSKRVPTQLVDDERFCLTSAAHFYCLRKQTIDQAQTPVAWIHSRRVARFLPACLSTFAIALCLPPRLLSTAPSRQDQLHHPHLTYKSTPPTPSAIFNHPRTNRQDEDHIQGTRLLEPAVPESPS